MTAQTVQRRLKYGKFHIMKPDGTREIKKPGDICELTPGQNVNFADQFEDPAEHLRAEEAAKAVRDAAKEAKAETAAEAKAETVEKAEAEAEEAAEPKKTKTEETKPKAKAG